MKNEIALYRKYRPQKFKTVIGQHDIIVCLENIIKNKLDTHAYIFSGTRGTGKTTIAKIFAKAINCLEPINGYDPCLKCKNCLAIDNNQTVDVIELDAASNNGVDDIRSIVDNVFYLPQTLKKKVYIIDEAHMLSNAAWNSLLKTLEEPPEYVVFILATTEFHKFPITIISRCQRYEFKPLKNEEIEQLIQLVVKQEKIKIEQEAINKIIELSENAARDALTILEQLAIYTNNDIKLEQINHLFGLVDQQLIINLLVVLSKKDVDSFMKILPIIENKNNLNRLVNEIMNYLIDLCTYLMSNKTIESSFIANHKSKFSNFTVEITKELLDTFYKILVDLKSKNNSSFFLKYHLFNYLKKEKTNIPTEIIVNDNKPCKTEIVKSTPKPEKAQTINIEKHETNYKLNVFDVFQKLALNNDIKELAKINDKLQDFKVNKQKINNEDYLQILQKIDKFYLFSNDVSILLCNDLITPLRFNEMYLADEKFRKLFRTELDNEKIIIIAISKNEASKFNKEIKASAITSIEKINYSLLKKEYNEIDKSEIVNKIRAKFKTEKEE